jgi:hypothetical protein
VTVQFDRNTCGQLSFVDAAPFRILADVIVTQHPHRLRFHEIM